MPDAPKYIVITREKDAPQSGQAQGFAARHPELAYVFGPTVRAFYVVGCLALDLFSPLQVLALLPDHELLAAPLLALAFAGVAFLQYRLYRYLWPARRGREAVGVTGARRI